MSTGGQAFMSKIFVGNPVKIGTLSDKYEAILMADETVEVEFKGVRDGMLFTDRRLVVLNSQGITGKKVEISSFPWRSITAFSVENSGTFDLDAEFKFCGSGWGVCEVMLSKGSSVREICQYVNEKVFGAH